MVAVPEEFLTEHRNLELCMDIVFANGLPMFMGIDRTIEFRSLVPLDSRTASKMCRALDVLLRRCNRSGHVVQRIFCDQEFKTMMEEVKDQLDVAMNCTSADEHVPEAERNNRTIQERIRTGYHRLPCKAMPKLMIRFLSMVSTHQLNLFPVKGGISDYFSPHVILAGEDWDYNKHCQVPFGAYVQATIKTTNANVPRTIDAIYLRPKRNLQGGHEVMNLATGRKVTSMKVTEIPVTPHVIKLVEEMAYKEGFKSLKFYN